MTKWIKRLFNILPGLWVMGCMLAIGVIVWLLHGQNTLAFLVGMAIGFFASLGAFARDHKHIDIISMLGGAIMAAGVSLYISAPLPMMAIIGVVGAAIGFFAPKWAHHILKGI